MDMDRKDDDWYATKLPHLAAFGWLLLLPLLLTNVLLFWSVESRRPEDGASSIWAAWTALAVVIVAGTAVVIVWLRATRRRSGPPLETSVAAPVVANEPSASVERRAGIPVADCVIDTDLWEAVQQYLTGFPQQEQGGLVLGFQQDGQTFFTAVIFPEQEKASGTWCEFSVKDVELVRTALDGLADLPAIDRLDVIVAWIHTHPRLRVFLSSTDRQTIKRWASLLPSVRAAVVDVFQPEFDGRLGVFDPDGVTVQIVRGRVGLPGELSEEFARGLRNVYEAARRRLPWVAMAGVEA